MRLSESHSMGCPRILIEGNNICMLGAGLQQDHGRSYKIVPVGNQHAVVSGCASPVFPAYMRRYSWVSSHSGPIGPHVSGHLNPLNSFFDVRVTDMCSILELGKDYSLISFLTK